MIQLFTLLSPRQLFKRSRSAFSYFSSHRLLTDTPKSDVTSKQVVVQGTENEQRLRVRRARPSDVPRLLRFVREHARTAWPCMAAPAPPAASHLVLADYVARALAQGHSMVAEQQTARRGWLTVRGLALAVATCPWDARVLERWSRCVRCAHSRRLVHVAAHCLHAPRLHHKYSVHNILQVIMIVPPNTPKCAEIVQVLAKNAVQRGRDVGIPLLRFDVTSEQVAKALEALQLRKEWHLSFDFQPEMDAVREGENAGQPEMAAEEKKGNFIAIYTASTASNETSNENKT